MRQFQTMALAVAKPNGQSNLPETMLTIAEAMAKLEIEPLPRNYELLHEMLRGGNADLQRDFAALGPRPRQADLDDLGLHYRLAGHCGLAASRCQSEAARLLGGLKEQLALGITGKQAFSRSLEATTRALAAPGTSLADWPVSYDEIEPYYLKVEWAFGVSGEAGANRFEGPRSGGYPCPPMPMSRYAQKFHQGCSALGWNSFPTPQAALSRPFGGRKATVVSAFAQQHGDPTGTRSSALNVFIPHAVATGNFELRPDCLVRELVLDSQGRIRAAIYQDAGGNLVEQEAGLFILACGAVETARLMLLSKSGRFPNGLANGSDLVGRNVTFHEYSAAVGTYEDPIYAWAGGGYVSASTFQHYEHDDSRGFVSGGHVAVAGVGIPLPINWHLPGAPGWGAEAKKVDRENFNHSLAVAMVLHDMPRHDNRVDLDDEVVDAWGLPVARVTLEAHENDLAQGRYLIDRGADILEASGARSVNKVYAQRVTGNCSHQHGTARMGDDPGLSVLNRWCRAHEVENLYAVDGSPFPTGTGANPTLTIMANAWRVADRIIATRGAAA